MASYNPHGYSSGRLPWGGHVCGLYYITPLRRVLHRTYLPQVELEAHATILATTSRTVLTQTFVNPSTEKGIREVRYTFPLYDGVSVVGFTCHVGDRTIVGEVKEKDKARAVFQEAVAKGETAGLLEQLPDASDVFTTTVGNIAPGARLVVKITYLGELKHDMEVDGTRFTIPNIICPRYGSYPGTLRPSTAENATGRGISIIVDAEMADGSFIQRLRSPTHPIAMTMGTTSVAPDAEPTMTKASATLSLGTAELDKDFVLQIIAKNSGIPKAVLETHPTIPNHRALMATLVPKFALPPEKPELVFVCDRSGSMSGSNITLVVQALKVFLKSLPVGVKFNICSFGSKHSFLWEKSVTYSQQTLDEAIRHAGGFSANYGGTEMLAPLRRTIEQRYKDMPLDIMLLTDGEIWNQQNLFDYLNWAVTEDKAPVRIFTLGIGNGVSHALIEGIAKAGNGFSQSVRQGEKMETKVVRMLKGALSPHINDYTLEVRYTQDGATSEDDDDFVIVEKVTDSLKVKLDLNDTNTKNETKKPVSLLDTSADPDKEEPPTSDDTGEARYAHLPKIAVPKIIQAPQNIPALFAFNRTNAYLLIGPDAPSAIPKSVILRGTSAHGPLELEIPIQILNQPGETIHQLAAKKAISELEQGRGWLPEAKDDTGPLLKTKFEGRFEDMVEREAVRLGVQFQVGGKWCSFVAVESNKQDKLKREKDAEAWEYLEDEEPDTFVNMDPSMSSQFSESLSSSSDSDFTSSARKKKCLSRMLETGSWADDDASRNDDHLVLEAMHQRLDATVERAEAVVGLVAKKPDSTSQAPHHLTGYMAQQQSAMMHSHTQSMPGYRQSHSGPHGMRRKNVRGLNTAVGWTSTSSPGPNPVYGTPGMSMPARRMDMFGGHGGGALLGTQAAAAPSLPYSAYLQNSGNLSFTRKAVLGGQEQQQAPDRRGLKAYFGEVPSSQEAYSANIGPMNTALPPPPQPAGLTSTNPDHKSLQDYQMQLMTLNQDSKNRRKMEFHFNTLTAESVASPSAKAQSGQGTRSGYNMNNSHNAARAQQTAADSTVDLGLGDGAALENFDFDSFLHVDGRETLTDNIENVTYNSVEDRKNHGSAKSKTSHYMSEMVSAASMPLADEDLDDMDEAWGGAPRSSSFSPGSPVEPNYNPVTPPGGYPNPVFSQAPPRAAVGEFMVSSPNPPYTALGTPEDLTNILISHQTFEGSWEVSLNVLGPLQITDAVLDAEAAKAGANGKVFITALVVAVFERKLREFEGSWELLVEKARGWLAEQVEDVEKLIGMAGGLVK